MKLERLTELFAALPEVDAVALGGSRAGEHADDLSDFDVYVYTNAAIPLEVRRGVVQALGGASVADMGMDYFGAGDEWQNAETGVQFDVMYFSLAWMREQLERVLVQHRPSLGYTTAFCYTVQHSEVLYDPAGRFAALQTESQKPYSEALRQAIVAYNHPLLRGTISSYLVQLEKAVLRHDPVSVNHRLAALLASYFDIVFAVNRLLHPGEKRLLELALATCSTLPAGFERDMAELLRSAGTAEVLLEHLGRLLGALDVWLKREGFTLGGSGEAA